jgi:hypothetical protein
VCYKETFFGLGWGVLSSSMAHGHLTAFLDYPPGKGSDTKTSVILPEFFPAPVTMKPARNQYGNVTT